MKKSLVLSSLLILTLSLSGQVQQYDISVTNVSVPVIVLKDNIFVDSLTVDDFEILEDGVPQKIQALYLTRKGQIERTQAERDFMPLTSRHFYLIFQLSDYNPRMSEAIDYFFTTVLQPGDSLDVVTPMKNYKLSPQALKSKSGETLAKELTGLIRKDTQIGAADFNSLTRDLKRLVRAISSASGDPSSMTDIESGSAGGDFGLEFLLPRYRDTLAKLDGLRIVDEKKFLSFANQLRTLDGRKVVFLFYQREFRPEIQSSILNRLVSMYQDQPNILGAVQDLFQMYSRELTLNKDLVQKAYSDASVLFNFIFMNKEPENISGIYMREQSEDVFSTFTALAESTGGITDNSQNPAAGFKIASEKSESAYLLYYSPENYAKDGNFKTITVRVKGQDLKVYHREGYFAR